MRRIVTIFCESFSSRDVWVFNKIIERLSYKPKFLFITFTPKACYQLEKLNVCYETPEMYYKVPDVKFNPYKEKNSRLRIFQIYKYEKERATVYWKQFLTEYIKAVYKDKKPVVLYFGKKTGLVNELKSNETLAKASIYNVNFPKQE